jgi:hypothetical protein
MDLIEIMINRWKTEKYVKEETREIIASFLPRDCDTYIPEKRTLCDLMIANNLMFDLDYIKAKIIIESVNKVNVPMIMAIGILAENGEWNRIWAEVSCDYIKENGKVAAYRYLIEQMEKTKRELYPEPQLIGIIPIRRDVQLMDYSIIDGIKGR